MTFNLLDYPGAFADPLWLRDPPGWVEHIPFAFLIVQLTAPRVFVELGTHSGNSYCAFCQGVVQAATQTRCTAIDTWKGDKHSLEYPETIFQELREYHDAHYGAFSRLLRATFDEALPQFAEGSIDLLHIDGLHTYEAVRHDFDTWLPRMSDRGVVLFHDSAIQTGDFGVHRLIAELKHRFPCFEFMHGFGLAVVVVGRQPPPAFQQFFDTATAHPDSVRSCFHALGRSIFRWFMLRSVTSQGILMRNALIDWQRSNGLSPADDPQLHQSHDLHAAMASLWRQMQNICQARVAPPKPTGPNIMVSKANPPVGRPSNP